MITYTILFTLGVQEISKNVTVENINEAIKAAKNPLMWPIEFHEDYPGMEVWISEQDSSTVLEHFNYGEL